jgi:hypothetical protein
MIAGSHARCAMNSTLPSRSSTALNNQPQSLGDPVLGNPAWGNPAWGNQVSGDPEYQPPEPAPPAFPDPTRPVPQEPPEPEVPPLEPPSDPEQPVPRALELQARALEVVNMIFRPRVLPPSLARRSAVRTSPRPDLSLRRWCRRSGSACTGVADWHGRRSA